jgi:hypothetical protein
MDISQIEFFKDLARSFLLARGALFIKNKSQKTIESITFK